MITIGNLPNADKLKLKGQKKIYLKNTKPKKTYYALNEKQISLFKKTLHKLPGAQSSSYLLLCHPQCITFILM